VNVFHQIIRRLLTVSETAIALRPFLFSVHPDLFGKFPKEQVTSDHISLQLNSSNSQHGTYLAEHLILFYSTFTLLSVDQIWFKSGKHCNGF